MRVRLVLLLALATAAIALVVAGCGGGDGGGSDPAAVMPAETPLYIGVTVRPEGDLKANTEALAEDVAGVDLGEEIVSALEQGAFTEEEDLDFEKDIEPWLGDNAGIGFQEFAGGDPEGPVIAVETTDTGAAEEFITDFATEVGDETTYQGSTFKVEEDDGTAVGMVDDYFVIAEDETIFKAVVDAAGDESLADQDTYDSAVDATAEESLADVFVDVGNVLEETGAEIDAGDQELLEATGIEPKEAFVIASVVPGAETLEIDFATNAAGDNPPTGDASQLLGSLPGGSFTAFAAGEFGARLNESIDLIDEMGIEGQIEPDEFKDALKANGIDLDKLTSGIGDLGLFAQGNTEANLTGAVVLTTKDAKEATNTVSNLGLLLRASDTPGVTALSGDAAGFSIRDPDLGDQPLVVAAKDDKIAISYGLAASTQALTAGEGSTLAENPTFKKAGDALGDTPLSGYIAGPATLALVDNLLSPEEAEEFEEARPYVEKIEYLAIGNGTSGDLATSKLIIGLSK